MNHDTLKQIDASLREKLQATRVELTDNSHLHAGHSGNVHGGGHYAVILQSAYFDGMNAVKRHQAVYQAVEELMSNKAIHALEIQALDSEGLA